MIIEVLGGNFSGTAIIDIGTLWTGPKASKFRGITFSNPAVSYAAEHLKRVKQLDSEKAKSFVGSAAAAGVGALLLGPVGLLAGGLAGGNRTYEVYGLEFADGMKAVIKEKAHDKGFMCLKLYARERGIMEIDF